MKIELIRLENSLVIIKNGLVQVEIPWESWRTDMPDAVARVIEATLTARII